MFLLLDLTFTLAPFILQQPHRQLQPYQVDEEQKAAGCSSIQPAAAVSVSQEMVAEFNQEGLFRHLQAAPAHCSWSLVVWWAGGRMEDLWLVFQSTDGWWWWWRWRLTNRDRLCAFILSVWLPTEEPRATAVKKNQTKKQRSAEEVETFVARLLKCNFNRLILSSFVMYLGYLHPN